MNAGCRTLIVAMAAIGLASCVTSPDESEWDTLNYAVTVDAMRTTTIFPDSAWTEDVVSASFAARGSLFLDAGDLTVAGIPIPSWSDNEGNQHYVRSGPAPQLPLRFEGEMVPVVIAGGKDIPALRDSLPAPRYQAGVLYPGIADTVSRADGFVLRWQGDGKSQVDVQLISVGGVEKQRAFKNVPDSGELAIPASAVAGFPTGQFTIILYRTSSKEGRYGAGKRYMLHVRSAAVTSATIAG